MNLFVFGLGYSALTLARAFRPRFDAVGGTVRSRAKADRLRGQGIAARPFDGSSADAAVVGDLVRAEALLVSAPPDEAGDPALRVFGDAIATAPRLRWIGYLSTVGVYGDHGGEWVDETTAPNPASARSKERLQAERAWLALGERRNCPAHVFRIAGIYGPGRNALVNLRDGTARRIVKPGQVFNRVHVDDIAAAIAAAMTRTGAAGIWNLADDEPAPPQDVVAYAAALLGVKPPPEVPFEEADLSPMGRSFYGEVKRVSNRRIRRELGVKLAYPTYREGLDALFAAGEGRAD